MSELFAFILGILVGILITGFIFIYGELERSDSERSEL